jgi:hypothetical protein
MNGFLSEPESGQQSTATRRNDVDMPARDGTNGCRSDHLLYSNGSGSPGAVFAAQLQGVLFLALRYRLMNCGRDSFVQRPTYTSIDRRGMIASAPN